MKTKSLTLTCKHCNKSFSRLIWRDKQRKKQTATINFVLCHAMKNIKQHQTTNKLILNF